MYDFSIYWNKTLKLQENWGRNKVHESHLWLIDLTLYTGLITTSGIVEVGCLTEALMLRREEQENK